MSNSIHIGLLCSHHLEHHAFGILRGMGWHAGDRSEFRFHDLRFGTLAEARRASRQEVVFTTHTPVIQGNESHELATMEFVGAFHGLTRDEMVDIGGDPFNMTVAALRLARNSNAVAQLEYAADLDPQNGAYRAELLELDGLSEGEPDHRRACRPFGHMAAGQSGFVELFLQHAGLPGALAKA